jgi:hypothetical protein
MHMGLFNFSVYFCTWLLSIGGQARWDKVAEISLSRAVLAVSSDVQGTVYVAERHGGVRQYDSTGKQLAYHSPTQVADVTALEARFGVRVYAFYQDLQRFTIFNRFLQPLEHYALPTEKVGFVQNVAWGADQNLWLYDAQEMRILRYNPLTADILLEVRLAPLLPLGTARLDIIRMQEYDHRLYIADGRQVWVIDYFGNLLATLPALPASCLYEGALWQLVGKEITIASLYETDKKKHIPFVEAPEKPLFLHTNSSKVWVIDSKKITIWTFKQD